MQNKLIQMQLLQTLVKILKLHQQNREHQQKNNNYRNIDKSVSDFFDTLSFFSNFSVNLINQA
jgi:hypothetical protein